jgi:hypothetical protein
MYPRFWRAVLYVCGLKIKRSQEERQDNIEADGKVVCGTNNNALHTQRTPDLKWSQTY